MCDFDLSSALEDSSTESDEKDYENSSCEDFQDEVRIDENVNLVVSHQHKKMKNVVTLVVCLRTIMKEVRNGLETLINEHVIKESDGGSAASARRIFTRSDSDKPYTLCDCLQKDLVQLELELKACTLRGEHSDRKVEFKMAKYDPCHDADHHGLCVVLSILDSTLFISCSVKGEVPTLNLEECETDLQQISAEGDTVRFLFYKNTTASSQTTFESVKYRGWFISTSSDEDMPVNMCQESTASRYTTFKIN